MQHTARTQCQAYSAAQAKISTAGAAAELDAWLPATLALCAACTALHACVAHLHNAKERYATIHNCAKRTVQSADAAAAAAHTLPLADAQTAALLCLNALAACTSAHA